MWTRHVTKLEATLHHDDTMLSKWCRAVRCSVTPGRSAYESRTFHDATLRVVPRLCFFAVELVVGEDGSRVYTGLPLVVCLTVGVWLAYFLKNPVPPSPFPTGIIARRPRALQADGTISPASNPPGSPLFSHPIVSAVRSNPGIKAG